MNKLASESSPYLLQHAHNPVNWFAWSDEAWNKAQQEGKLVLVSIGYSACHWCHVMEREVFEDLECAKHMNEHFVCIKVDREELPDVDHVYMDAMHLMGQQGGWPLNVFVLPDKRPIYGGTYFPKKNWLSVLENLHDLYTHDTEKVMAYASKLSAGLSHLSTLEVNKDGLPWDIEFLDRIVEHWSQYWDVNEGGGRKAPKFPMPANWQFLLHYSHETKSSSINDFVHLTLTKMAQGGIYDQVGGGFARYSVDDMWKVPHFEKMLYDNAQLLSVFAQAQRQRPTVLYRRTLEDTLHWLEREMKTTEGLYYSALDADSEGEEGKFYVWNLEAWQKELGSDAPLAAEYFCIDKEGLWEHGNSIPLVRQLDAEFCAAHNFSSSDFENWLQSIKQRLLEARSSRVRPGTDTKCLLSWNAMLGSAFIESYRALGTSALLDRAKDLWLNIEKNFMHEDGTYVHAYTNGRRGKEVFLEDLAFLGHFALDLYESTAEDKYLFESRSLMGMVMDRFFDERDGMFLYSTNSDLQWSGGKKEIQDNVIPSSNAVVCHWLLRLSVHLGNNHFKEVAEQMLHNALPQIDFASGYAEWLRAYCHLCSGGKEVVCVGEEALAFNTELRKEYLPGVLYAASTTESSLPLFEGRFGKVSAIYVCRDHACSAPVHHVNEALQLLQ
jgi:uncharacterized protein YyaL (SSP411 family)